MSRALYRRALLPLLLILLTTLLPTLPLYAAPALAPDLVAALDAMLAAARADAHAPGALLYVNVPGQGTYSAASGLANVATNTPLAPDARFRVASVTKPFVAVVALQLVQEGWLLLDHNVEHWLPGLVPGGEKITVRQLLNHTSGLPDYLSDALINRARREPEHAWKPEELVAEALRGKRPSAPGARWEYSNTNYIVLGLIIERVTNHSLDLELRQRIFEPLGLRNTSLAPASADPGDLAHGYVGGTDHTTLNLSVAWAAGAISSTVDDLGQFAQALVGGALLRPDILNTMLAFERTGGAWGIADLVYGLGMMRRALPAAGLPVELRTAIGHTGALEGYRTSMWYFPGSGITIVAAFTREEVDPNRLVSGALLTLASHGVFA